MKQDDVLGRVMPHVRELLAKEAASDGITNAETQIQLASILMGISAGILLSVDTDPYSDEDVNEMLSIRNPTIYTTANQVFSKERLPRGRFTF